jgi:hypothetical protein
VTIVEERGWSVSKQGVLRTIDGRWVAMRLVDLEPEFVKVVIPGQIYHDVDTMQEAQGVRFLCPKCFVDNGGRPGTHYVQVWFRDHGVGDEEVPKPGRWAVSGTGLEDLSLSPSILLGSGCRWHGFVEKGEIRTA